MPDPCMQRDLDEDVMLSAADVESGAGVEWAFSIVAVLKVWC